MPDPSARDNEVLARIRRVKSEYKAGKGKALEPEVAGVSTPAQVPLTSALPSSGRDVEERFASAAQAAAAQEEQAFIAAMQDTTRSPTGHPLAGVAAPASAEPVGTSPAAVRARLAKAREYKAKTAPKPARAGQQTLPAPAGGSAVAAEGNAKQVLFSQPAIQLSESVERAAVNIWSFCVRRRVSCVTCWPAAQLRTQR